jgi:hypothetical protein
MSLHLPHSTFVSDCDVVRQYVKHGTAVTELLTWTDEELEVLYEWVRLFPHEPKPTLPAGDNTPQCFPPTTAGFPTCDAITETI